MWLCFMCVFMGVLCLCLCVFSFLCFLYLYVCISVVFLVEKCLDIVVVCGCEIVRGCWDDDATTRRRWNVNDVNVKEIKIDMIKGKKVICGEVSVLCCSFVCCGVWLGEGWCFGGWRVRRARIRRSRRRGKMFVIRIFWLLVGCFLIWWMLSLRCMCM